MSSLRAAFARERTAPPGCTIYVWLVGGRAALTDPWVSGVRLVPGGVRSPCVWPWGCVPSEPACGMPGPVALFSEDARNPGVH